MEIKNKYIVFDTNMWIKILSQNSEINRDILLDIQKNNQLGIYNISLVEILMRFVRKNNLSKIRAILEYMKENLQQGNLSIGNIYCPNFSVDGEKITELVAKNDEEIVSAIGKYAIKRFEFKSSIIALWIIILLELFCPAFADNEKHADNIVECCENKANKIKGSLVEYFISIENSDQKIKHLRDITNKIFKEILNEIAVENNFVKNEKYIQMNSTINKLKPEQSISYIFKGVYDSELMKIYRKRVDRTLNLYFNSTNLKEIFYARLKAFMQGECLQKNDVEDMLMLSVLEMDSNIILVTDDNKMISFMNDDRYKQGNIIHDMLIIK